MIPEDIEKWLSNPKHGSDWQDMDLVLADVEFLPLLKAYLNDPVGVENKKFEIVSALLELLEHDCPKNGGAEAARLANDIKETIKRHAGIAEKAMDYLGPVGEVVLRSILGLPISPDCEQWIIDRARENGAEI